MNLNESARFFVVYPIDLEDLGVMELKEKFAQYYPSETLIIIATVLGGVEIDCPLYIGLSLNRILRTPTRLLLRIGEFKCRDAPKLFQKMSKFNWAPWLVGQTPEVVSASTNSRLFDSRKIEKAIQDGIVQYYKHKPTKKKYLEHWAAADKNELPKIYFRAVDDVCTISIDTTGERLHLRGEKILTGLAPIRESLAALLLMEIKTQLKSETYTLIDPMCGSGTILLESLDSNSVTTKRAFSFLHMPIILDDKTVMKDLKGMTSQIFSHYLGFEINPEVVALAKRNCLETPIQINEADLFDGKKWQVNGPSVVVMNPPYGKRVGEKEEINSQYYLRIIEALKNKFNPELAGIIIPADYKIKATKEFSIYSARPFKNGGIEVVFYVLGFK